MRPHRRRPSRAFTLLRAGFMAALSFAWANPTSAARAGEAPDEFALKAAFLFNFTRFVEWPATAFSSPEEPFRVCVVGEDPFGTRLVALRQQSVGERPIRVEYPSTTEALARCQMAYIADGATSPLRTAASRRVPSTLLTVSSDSRFVRQGGMVSLVTDAGRVRLHVNLEIVRRSRLRVLEIAQVRHGEAGTQR